MNENTSCKYTLLPCLFLISALLCLSAHGAYYLYTNATSTNINYDQAKSLCAINSKEIATWTTEAGKLAVTILMNSTGNHDVKYVFGLRRVGSILVWEGNVTVNCSVYTTGCHWDPTDQGTGLFGYFDWAGTKLVWEWETDDTTAIGVVCQDIVPCTNLTDCNSRATIVSGNRPSCTCTCSNQWTGPACVTAATKRTTTTTPTTTTPTTTTTTTTTVYPPQ